MKRLRDIRETPANAIGSGNIAGTSEAGHNPPGRRSRLVRRKRFAQCEVFVVDADRYNRCNRAKLRTERFSKFVGEDATGLAIREYGRDNPGKGIMIEDESTGAMTYLRLPRGRSGVQF
jgi:hypothetical protein